MRTKTEKRRRKAVLKIPPDWVNIILAVIALSPFVIWPEPLNERALGQHWSWGALLVYVCLALLFNCIQYSFYEDAVIFKLFGIPIRRIRWERVSAVGVFGSGKSKHKQMRDCVAAGEMQLILVLGKKVNFNPCGDGKMPISFNSIRWRDRRKMMLHLLAIVSIPLVRGIDGAPYIDFVLQHTGKKLSFGDPNEGMEGDVQDTHSAEQPNDPDEK